MKRWKGICHYLFLILPVLLVVWVYSLKMIFALPLFAASCLALWKIRAYRQEDKNYESAYVQVATYLEQLLCSYRRLGHAGKALSDCCLLFEESSPMKCAISQAEHILHTGEGVVDGSLLSAAFSAIEERFDSRRMRIIHRFICNGEKTGAESGRSADILLEDLELWKNRTKIYESKKRFIKIECLIATILAMMLCYVSRLLTPEELGFDLADGMIYQLSTVGVFLLFLWLITHLWKKLTGSWLDEKGFTEEAQYEHQKKLYGMLRGEASTLSRHMAKKILSRYVKEEFSYWLLLVTLYLQTESGYQALRYSAGAVEGVFRLELEQLIEEIYDSPRSLEPYLNFFSPLAIPEVQSGMKILYSVNTNGYEDSKKQLDFLVAQNNRLMDKNESYHHSNKMAGMSMLKQLPMVLSCLKLLIDLVNLLAVTMGSFQSMQL